MTFLLKPLAVLLALCCLSACTLFKPSPLLPQADAPVSTATTTPPLPPPELLPTPPLTPVAWEAVDGWLLDDPTAALAAFVKGCATLKKRADWGTVCTDATRVKADSDTVRRFFEERFTPHQVRNPDGSDTGLVTGYYIPNLNGSRQRSDRFRYPLYAVPDDLLIIDLRSVYPDLANYRLRGRLVGRKVVPYYSRAELDTDPAPLAGKELLWTDDPVELFFMHIQGSGKVLLDDGSAVMVHFADQNGYPFRSIGKLLLDRGEMTREQMSMQNIKAWAQQHPGETAALLNENASYVFFTTLPGSPDTAPGAFGVPLIAERSIAVDTRTIPLGAPVFLSTTRPSSKEPLQRLVLAHDTGGAIRGPVRADFFWGQGEAAGALAGRMKQKGKMWVLLPRTEAINTSPVTE
jgi:membrane-bound lytic murein transglycosylase A